MIRNEIDLRFRMLPLLFPPFRFASLLMRELLLDSFSLCTVNTFQSNSVGKQSATIAASLHFSMFILSLSLSLSLSLFLFSLDFIAPFRLHGDWPIAVVGVSILFLFHSQYKYTIPTIIINKSNQKNL